MSGASQWAQRNSGFIPPSRLGQPEQPRREFTSGPLQEPAQPRPQSSPAPASNRSSFFSFGKKSQHSPPPPVVKPQQQPTPASSPPPNTVEGKDQLYQPQPQQHSSSPQQWREIGRPNSGSIESFRQSQSLGIPPAPASRNSHTSGVEPYALPPDTRRQSSYEGGAKAASLVHSRQMSEGHSSVRQETLPNRLTKPPSREAPAPASTPPPQRPQSQQFPSNRTDASSIRNGPPGATRTLHPELRSVVGLNIARTARPFICLLTGVN